MYLFGSMHLSTLDILVTDFGLYYSSIAEASGIVSMNMRPKLNLETTARRMDIEIIYEEWKSIRARIRRERTLSERNLPG